MIQVSLNSSQPPQQHGVGCEGFEFISVSNIFEDRTYKVSPPRECVGSTTMMLMYLNSYQDSKGFGL